jgi:cytoskeletal protein RodZ
MIEFGKTLRLAREAKGYSVSQLAEATRMIHQTIEDLENENFTRIAAPIYGRGFVKLYCEAVGLDPKPMVAEFMEIFNGNRELGIKERVAAPEEKPVPENETIREKVVSNPETTAETADALGTEETSVQPEAIPESPPPVKRFDFTAGATASARMEFDLPEPQPAEAAKPRESRLSRYAAPLREASLPSIPPSFWRIGTLAVALIVILWLLALGFKALYKATSGAADSAGESAIEETVKPDEPKSESENVKAPAANANIAREKVEVPPLYVD